ncbi:Coiled-coil domain containing protein [Gracilaria domingensis]|nr:Coiled-coil domain containing protein [Gracilaria domingensis]
MIKTDPKNSDYTCESGVRRNYEPWKEEERLQKESKEERERQDQDVMQALENKTVDAKKELEDLDALNELKSVNAQRASITVDDVLAQSRAQQRNLEHEMEAQLREQARKLFKNKRQSEVGYRSALSNLPKPNIPQKTLSVSNASTLSSDKITLKVRKKISKSHETRTKTQIESESLTGLADYSSSSESD